MKKISDSLIRDIQIILESAVHPKYSWAQIAEVKKQLMELEEAEEKED